MIDREDEGAWTSDEDADDVPKHGHKPGIESGLAREWWFMADWMRKTRGCFTLVEDERFLVDPLRIGPDGNDKWINVSIANKEPARSLWNDDSALVEGHEWRFPMLRDAMLLQSMMAHSDYDAWIKSLVKIGGVKAPKYVHLNMNKPSWSTTLLKPRFSITIPPYMNPKYYEWAFLQEIFQATTLSKDIKTGYTTMIKLVTSKGVDDASIQPVSLKLRFVPQHVGYLRQLAVIRNIRSVVERFNQSGAKSQYLFPDDSPAAPVFHLEQMDLDFSAFSLHPTVLRAIEKLITTSGVSIGLLRLPSDPFNGDFDESTLRTAWASLVCTLFGDIHFRHDSQTERFPTTIDHIDVPWMYTCTELCEPLFMAAKDARRVRSVRIDMNAQLHNRQSTACRYFGSLIGYAFFSAQSASSIESVELGRLAASNRFDESMVDVATSQDALGSLWAKINGLSYSNGASLNKEIVLKRGTMLHPRSKLTEIKIPAPWSAFILFDDSSEPFVDVYAPGFGLCTVDRSDIQNKKRRLCTSQTEQNEDRQADGGSLLQDTRRLRTLAISLWPNRDGHDHQDPTDTNYFSVELPYFIERVGSLIGNSLEGLAVDSQDTNEWVIRSICKCFPHLRQLKLVGGSFGSLGFIMEAYQNDCRITSIELSGTNIPIDQFELFLQFLISDPKGKSTIQQLSVGKDWLQDFRRQTMVLFQRLLQKCRQLSYLDLHVDNCDDRHALQDQHGEFIPGAPLALPNRLAFVSVRNHPTQADLAIAKLDEAVLQLVFEFAGAVKNRNVIVKRNTIIPVIRRLLFDF